MQGRGRGGGGVMLTSLPLGAFCLNPFPRCLQNSNFLVKVSSLCIPLVFYIRFASRKMIQSTSHKAWERVAELKKESHRPEPCEVNAKRLSVSEWWCQTLARPRNLCNVGLRSERVTVGSVWSDVSHTLVIILGYFISAIPALKKKFCVSFMFEI